MTNKTDLVVWSGPVAQFQVPGATVPGAKEVFFSCRGDQGDWVWCPGLGAEMAPSPSILLDRVSVPRAQLGDLVFGGFSAGGSYIKRLMEKSDYRTITTAVMLSDATYTASWADPQNHIPPPIPGFVDWATAVLNGLGDKLFVATASPVPNQAWASGVQNLQALRAEIEKRSGRRFRKLDGFYGVEPTPDVAYKLGNVIFAEYPLKPLGHHHNEIAPAVWQRILVPWLQKGKGDVDSPFGLPQDLPKPQMPAPSPAMSSFEKLLLFGVGVGGGVAAGALLR